MAALGAEPAATIQPTDILRPPPASTPADLVLLDPPYHRELAAAALRALGAAGWLAPETIVVVETAADEDAPSVADLLLAARRVGAARLHVFSAMPPETAVASP